jgi:23S rRNA pseudouridine955/2504/2580 synthase
MILFSLCNRQVQFIIKPVAFPPVEINIWYNQQAMIKITVSPNEDKQRLDRFLRKYLKAAPLSLIYRLIRKDVKVNGRRAERDYMLAAGDLIELYIDEGQLEALSKKKEYPTVRRQFTIAYEDEDVLAVSKPFGLLVHGDAEEKKHTLANQVIDYLIGTGSYVPRIERTFVPSPVHRLDRNTTGLVLFGKNAEALRVLSALMREGAVRRFYTTIVTGSLNEELHLTGRLHKDRRSNISSVIDRIDDEHLNGKHIETIVRPLYAGKMYSVVEVELVTGRSHQIRAHLQSAGYPLICDRKYGSPVQNAALKGKIDWQTQLLHAGRLVIGDVPAPLEHLSGIEITAPVPPHWKDIQLALFDKEIVPHGNE